MIENENANELASVPEYETRQGENDLQSDLYDGKGKIYE